MVCGTGTLSASRVGPDDIDVAQLYDPYSIGGIMQLEELGFCERGESGKFIEGGDNIRVGGKIPVTHRADFFRKHTSTDSIW